GLRSAWISNSSWMQARAATEGARSGADGNGKSVRGCAQRLDVMPVARGCERACGKGSAGSIEERQGETKQRTAGVEHPAVTTVVGARLSAEASRNLMRETDSRKRVDRVREEKVG